MASTLLDSLHQTPARIPGGVRAARVVATRGSTDASGNMTLDTGATYDGLLSAPSRSTNTYTLTIGPFVRLLACIPRSGIGSTVSSITSDGTAGTVTWTFSAAQVSCPVDVIIYVDRGMGG